MNTNDNKLLINLCIVFFAFKCPDRVLQTWHVSKLEAAQPERCVSDKKHNALVHKTIMNSYKVKENLTIREIILLNK